MFNLLSVMYNCYVRMACRYVSMHQISEYVFPARRTFNSSHKKESADSSDLCGYAYISKCILRAMQSTVFLHLVLETCITIMIYILYTKLLHSI